MPKRVTMCGGVPSFDGFGRWYDANEADREFEEIVRWATFDALRSTSDPDAIIKEALRRWRGE